VEKAKPVVEWLQSAESDEEWEAYRPPTTCFKCSLIEVASDSCCQCLECYVSASLFKLRVVVWFCVEFCRLVLCRVSWKHYVLCCVWCVCSLLVGYLSSQFKLLCDLLHLEYVSIIYFVIWCDVRCMHCEFYISAATQKHFVCSILLRCSFSFLRSLSLFVLRCADDPWPWSIHVTKSSL
jgi:hypothetical protein